MFDDPKKELQRLEQLLLNAELPDDDFDRFYAEIYDEFGTQDPDLDDILDDLLAEEAPELMSIHTGSQFNGYNAQPAPKAQQPQQRPQSSQQRSQYPQQRPQQRPQSSQQRSQYPQQRPQQRPQTSSQQRPQQRPQQPMQYDGYTDDRRYAPPAKKETVGKGLPIILCLETLGIVGVVVWWLLRIL